MSTQRAVWIECDADDCEDKYPSHLGLTTSEAARRQARQAGWLRREGRDLCPEHNPQRHIPKEHE